VPNEKKMKKSSKSGKNAEKTRRFGEKRRICGKIVQDNATGVLRFDTDTARELRYASSPALCSLSFSRGRLPALGC